MLRRLNRAQYENTVRDLFAVNVALKEMLPDDTIGRASTMWEPLAFRRC